MLDKIIYVQVTGMLRASASFRHNWIQGAPCLLLPLVCFPFCCLHFYVKFSMCGSKGGHWNLWAFRVLTASSPRRERDLCHFLSLSPRAHFSNLTMDSDCLSPWANYYRPEPFCVNVGLAWTTGSFCGLQEPPGMGRSRFPMGGKKRGAGQTKANPHSRDSCMRHYEAEKSCSNEELTCH